MNTRESIRKGKRENLTFDHLPIGSRLTPLFIRTPARSRLRVYNQQLKLNRSITSLLDDSYRLYER